MASRQIAQQRPEERRKEQTEALPARPQEPSGLMRAIPQYLCVRPASRTVRSTTITTLPFEPVTERILVARAYPPWRGKCSPVEKELQTSHLRENFTAPGMGGV